MAEISPLLYAKIKHFYLDAGTGVAPTLFPADDDTHYVRTAYIKDCGQGNFIIQVNPIDDTDGGYLMQQFFDLYYSGAKKSEGENLDLGEWNYITKPHTVGSDSLAVSFSDLYLDWTRYGLSENKSLPAYIPHPAVGVFAIVSDAAGVFIHEGSVTTSGFTVSRKPGWESPDVKVQFKINGG